MRKAFLEKELKKKQELGEGEGRGGGACGVVRASLGMNIIKLCPQIKHLTAA